MSKHYHLIGTHVRLYPRHLVQSILFDSYYDDLYRYNAKEVGKIIDVDSSGARVWVIFPNPRPIRDHHLHSRVFCVPKHYLRILAKEESTKNQRRKVKWIPEKYKNLKEVYQLREALNL